MKHERETLGAVVDARSSALNPLSDAMQKLIAEQEKASEGAEKTNLEDEAALKKLSDMHQTLGNSLKNLIAVSENYPDLRSADQFLTLQAQLEGTENRINVARMDFNLSVEEFNSSIRRLPGSLVAGIGNFKRKAYFQTEAGQDSPVKVTFDKE